MTMLASGGDSDRVEQAVEAVERLGSWVATPVVLQRLLDISENGTETLQLAAVTALASHGHAALVPNALNKTLASLDSKATDARRAALEAIGALGSAAATPAVLEKLLELFADEDVTVEVQRAVERLTQAETLPLVLARLEDFLDTSPSKITPELFLAASTIHHLGRIAAKPTIVSKLVGLSVCRSWHESLVTEDQMVSTFLVVVRLSLRSLRLLEIPRAVLDSLVGLMNDESAGLRKAAVATVGDLGVAAATPEVLERLLKLLDDEKWEVREEVSQTVQILGSASATDKIVRHLVKALDKRIAESDSRVRTSGTESGFPLPGGKQAEAVNVIRMIASFGGSAARPHIMSRLIKSMHDEDLAVRSEAAQALGRFMQQGVRLFRVLAVRHFG